MTRRPLPSTVRVLLAWLPFFVTWVLFLRVFAREPLEAALLSGVAAVTNAAVLGVGVWWLTGRLTWPDRVRPAFYAIHVAAGTLYAALWILSGHLLALAFTGQGTLWMLQATNLIVWRFLMGLYLYGLVAGVSYAVRMRRHVTTQEAAAASAKALAAESRLQSLRAQVNPHFLFNALHSVAALTRTEPAAARDAIEKLGDLLHYALHDDAREHVRLTEEWEFAERYLALERLRLADRLTVRRSFGPGAADCLVPPFLIQGLVENAVRHGIAPSVSGGTIEVTATVDAGRLTIDVTDNGTGTGAGSGAAGATGGRGLRLLRERLAGLYGADASIDAAPRRDGGYAARVVIPARPAGAPPDGVES